MRALLFGVDIKAPEFCNSHGSCCRVEPLPHPGHLRAEPQGQHPVPGAELHVHEAVAGRPRMAVGAMPGGRSEPGPKDGGFGVVGDF